MLEVRDPMEGVVTTACLADELGLRQETIVRHIKEHRLNGAFKERGRWLIPEPIARAYAEDYTHENDEPGSAAEEDFE